MRALALAFFGTLLTLASAQSVQWSRVRINTPNERSDIQRLARLGLEVDHPVEHTSGFITVELSDAELAQVRSQGFHTQVVIPDLVAHYRSTSRNGEERALGWLCDGPRLFGDPTHFEEGSMAGFLRWDEMLAELDEMVSTYPGIISSVGSIGTTIEGRPIPMVRVSNAPNEDQDKPEVLYSAVHHAREPASMSQLIFYMWYLLENYGTDAEVTYLVDNRELYFVPCLNPDGYVYNETTDPDGFGMWRKNRRDNGDGTFGVDLNRNYGWLWGVDDAGSSPDPNSATYRGAAAFSEPETQAMRDFCNAHEFRLALNHHTFGDKLIHPWTYGLGALTDDSTLFVEEARLLVRNNGYHAGTCDQVLFYTSNGSSDDWMYGDESDKPKIQAFTPEAGIPDEGFWPPFDRIRPICRENVEQNLMLAHLAGAYAKATDLSAPVIATTEAYIPFDLLRVGIDAATFTVSIEPLLNVQSTGAPKVFAGMQPLEQLRDSISVTLPTGLANGSPVRFVIGVDNGLFTVRDTVERRFDAPLVVFADDANDLNDWTSTNWALSTATYFSPPSSFTDSPSGDSAPFQTARLRLAEPIDLTNATSATLRFMTRFDINRYVDRGEVQASTNGQTWTNLCGVYTIPGSEAQVLEEPVYEATHREWVREEMDLTDHVGGPVYLRFGVAIASDDPRDGFFVDDIEVITTGTSTGIGQPAHTNGTISLVPNPANDLVRIGSPDLVGTIVLVNASGQVVSTQQARSASSHVMDLRELEPGCYTIQLRDASGAVVAASKLLIAR